MAEPLFVSDAVTAEEGKELAGASTDKNGRAQFRVPILTSHRTENNVVKAKEQGVSLINTNVA